MPSRVRQLLDRLTTQGVTVKSLETDSRAVQPGDVFLAWPGSRDDGRRHIGSAIAAGAAAVIHEQAGFQWDAQWTVPGLAVDGLREFAGPLADEVYGHPSEKLWTMGVTGTNGKTSCSQWLARACSECGARTAVIGTLGMGMPGQLSSSVNTTPDPVLLQRSLARLLAEGAQGVAMEVSSIGLEQGRVNGMRFGAALFTNLSRDHLDYHGDMESYARAKQKLFEMPGLKQAVLNMDDVQGVQIARLLAGGSVNRIGYSLYEHVARRAGLAGWLEAHEATVSARGIAFTVRSSWGEARIESRLIGRFNMANLLGVLGMMLVSGVPFADATAALARLESVPGRMQRLGGEHLPMVVVDFAHSPNALEQTLSALRDARATGGRLICVFGCGGDRDRGKRPLMGAVAARHADRILLTSDNPRSEDPAGIIAEIMQGMPAGAKVEIEADRVRAIGLAVAAAQSGDVVLLAGKGHEEYQEVQGRRDAFSDAAHAQAALARWQPAGRLASRGGNGGQT